MKWGICFVETSLCMWHQNNEALIPMPLYMRIVLFDFPWTTSLMCLGLELLYYFLLFFKNYETILVFLLSLMDALLVPCRQWKAYKVTGKKDYHWSRFLVSVSMTIARPDQSTCSCFPTKIKLQNTEFGFIYPIFILLRKEINEEGKTPIFHSCSS